MKRRWHYLVKLDGVGWPWLGSSHYCRCELVEIWIEWSIQVSKWFWLEDTLLGGLDTFTTVSCSWSESSQCRRGNKQNSGVPEKP